MKDPTHAWIITIALSSVPFAFAYSIASVGHALKKWIDRR